MLMGMSHNTKESGARNFQWDDVWPSDRRWEDIYKLKMGLLNKFQNVCKVSCQK